MVPAGCNQKDIQEFSEHRDGEFISTKEFHHDIKMVALGQSHTSVKGSRGDQSKQE